MASNDAPDDGTSPERAAVRVRHIQELGAAEGLRLDLFGARPVNSHDAHRPVHLAAPHGPADQTLEALLRGCHTDGLDIAAPDVVMALDAEAGLDPAEACRVLDGDLFGAGVRAAERGIRGVRALVVDGGPPSSAVQGPAAPAHLLGSASRT
ncbi:DsbA family protein [Streptomyces sp. NPDC058001]|uniref:DsbA family protein n=1 Tax=Streptomyces sp. NPDC058001 TaxID=3346300 RepID=UPI0036ECC7C8